MTRLCRSTLNSTDDKAEAADMSFGVTGRLIKRCELSQTAACMDAWDVQRSSHVHVQNIKYHCLLNRIPDQMVVG